MFECASHAPQFCVCISVCVYMCKIIIVYSANLGACVVVLNLFIFTGQKFCQALCIAEILGGINYFCQCSKDCYILYEHRTKKFTDKIESRWRNQQKFSPGEYFWLYSGVVMYVVNTLAMITHQSCV